MSNIWVTADTHFFFHTNICGPSISTWDKGYRDFPDLATMNEWMLANINDVVKHDDILWHLGDFTVGNKREIPSLRQRIRCKYLCLIEGNHDKPVRHKCPELFDDFWDIQSYQEIRLGKKLVCMFHYPIDSWNEVERGSVHLHGHCHGNRAPIGRRTDVGVDCNNFKPLNLEEVVAQLRQRDIVVVDHYGKDTCYA